MSSNTTSGRFLKIDKGEFDGTWSTKENENFKDMVDEAIFGVVAITVNAAVTLSNDNGITNQARQRVHVLSGTGGFAVTVPSVDNTWMVVNGCAVDVTYTAGNTAATIRAGTKTWVYCDGIDCYAADPTLDQIKAAAAAVDFNGQRATNGADPTANQDFATKAYADSLAISTSPDIPGQPGNAGKVLKTDGAVASWGSIPDILTYTPANLVSPTFTGTPGGPTATPATSTTQFATTEFVTDALDAFSAGGMVLLSTQTISSAVSAVEIITGIDSTYDIYEIHFSNLTLQTGHDGGDMWLKTSSDAGVTFDVSGYTTATTHATPGGTATGVSDISARIKIGIGLGASANEEGVSGVIRLYRPWAAEYTSYEGRTTFINQTGQPNWLVFSGVKQVAEDINAVQFSLSTAGNIETGSVQLYGLAKTL